MYNVWLTYVFLFCFDQEGVKVVNAENGLEFKAGSEVNPNTQYMQPPYPTEKEYNTKL